MMKIERWIVSFVALAALAGPSCASTSQDKSTGTNWLTCTDDDDCAIVEGAKCGHDGICTDSSGTRLSRARASELSGKDAGPPCETIHAADYDLTCTVDQDCTLVPEGNDLCFADRCICDNAPISASSEARYRTDLARIRPVDRTGVCHCPGAIAPVCHQGVCTDSRRVPVPDAGQTCGTISAADYDQTCTKNDDCVIVNDGDLCDADRCDCGNAVISAGVLAKYDADFDAKNGVPALICPCIQPFPPVCKGGVCAMGSGEQCGTINAKDYDQRCSKNEDCVLVNQGNLCESARCDCPNATVSATDKSRYDADHARMSVPATLGCLCTNLPPPVCKEGACAMGTPP